MQSELHRQPGQQRDYEEGEDDESLGLGSDEKRQSGHRRPAKAEGTHAPRPLPVSTARVAQGGGQNGEDDADDVLLLVKLGDGEPDHQQDSANGHAGGQTECLPIDRKHLGELAHHSDQSLSHGRTAHELVRGPPGLVRLVRSPGLRRQGPSRTLGEARVPI